MKKLINRPEAVVDDLTPWSHLVRIPAHRVLAVVKTPLGAHPGGVFVGSLPVQGYGEDIAFWTEARAACRGDFDAWARKWCLDVPTQDAYLARLGADRQAWLRARTDRESWRDDQEAHPVLDRDGAERGRRGSSLLYRPCHTRACSWHRRCWFVRSSSAHRRMGSRQCL